MTRKLSRDQAVSPIIRGFMDVSIMGLPESINEEINRIEDLVAEQVNTVKTDLTKIRVYNTSPFPKKK